MALMSGVAPSPPGASTAAPPSSQARAAATWPRSAATCKARSPSFVDASAGQFCASKAETASSSFFSTAARTTAPSLSPVSGGLERRSELGGTAITAPGPARRGGPRRGSGVKRHSGLSRSRRAAPSPTHHIEAVAPSWAAFGSASLSSKRRRRPASRGARGHESRTVFGVRRVGVPALGDQARSTSTSAFAAAATTASSVGGPQLNNTRVARCRATMSAVRPFTSRFDASAPCRSSTAQTLAAPTAAEAINAVRPSRSVASTSVTLASTSSTQTWPSIAAIRG